MSSSTRISIFLLFTTLALLSTQIHARESHFFGKFQRESPKDQTTLPFEATEKTTVQEPLPNEKEQEQDPTFVPESENGYGLYGHETTYNNKYDDKVNDKTFSTPRLSETEESYDQNYAKSYDNNGQEFNNKYDEKANGKTFSTPSLSETQESYDQNYPKSYANNDNEEFNNRYDEKVNGKTFPTPSLSETQESYDQNYPKSYDNNGNEEFNNDNKYDENVKDESLYNEEDNKRSFYKSNAYGTELERETPYKGYSHNLERQGMSDTRFMENGNYHYDLYNPKNHGHYYRKPQFKTPAGYYSSPATDNTYDQSYNEEEKSFKDPYNSKWEKNLMNEQPYDQFKP